METMDRALNDPNSLVEAPPVLETSLPIVPAKESASVLPQYGMEGGYGVVMGWMGLGRWYGLVMDMDGVGEVTEPLAA